MHYLQPSSKAKVSQDDNLTIDLLEHETMASSPSKTYNSVIAPNNQENKGDNTVFS